MMRVAIVGCGQLARMMALAGWPLGLKFSFLAEAGESTACVDGLGDIVGMTDSQTPADLYQALGRPDVITVEKESVDVGLLRALSGYCRVHPSPGAIEVCQNRALEKDTLNRMGVATVDYRLAHSQAEIEQAVAALGLPVVMKSLEQGYDGKHQYLVKDPQTLEQVCETAGEQAWMLEQWVAFEREVSLVAVRSAQGEVLVYPAVDNHHVDGVLRRSLAPADDLAPALLTSARGYLHSILERWDYVGVLAMECFVLADRILVNELAPRVHNSGHWTQQGSVTSQFENHLRAVCGLPLGATDARGYTGMVNLLGPCEQLDLQGWLSSCATLHLYNKTSAPRRKLGHINVQHADKAELLQAVQRLERMIYPAEAAG